MLSDETTSGDLSSVISDIVAFDEKKAPAKDKDKHYFEVVLTDYNDDIHETLNDTNFRLKLTQMLPLQYGNRFTKAKTILRRYKVFMNEDLKRFMIPVQLDGETLYKNYDNSCVLDSDIIFWEVRGKKKKDGSAGDKIGLLWFTFAAHLKAHGNEQCYGILTRSKNVLMGGNDTFAQVADSSSSYVTTFREMAQALRGVYGELLINSQHLSDNSRRDWFLPDEHSRDLNNVITDFMRRLNEYRYCSSRYFRKRPTKTREELKTALDELVDLKAHSIKFEEFSRRAEEPATAKQPSTDSLADEDIPHASKSMKKHYDALMQVIEAYFRKIKKRVLFLELRAFVAKHFEQE
jgi:molecular chaperone HtpG